MSWIEKHESEVFRKHVREELSRRLSDKGYECDVEEHECGFWYGRKMFRINVNFSYLSATLQIRLETVPEYWDYRNETVRSACDKIIERLENKCRKFSPDRFSFNREYYSVDFLIDYIFSKLGVEDE